MSPVLGAVGLGFSTSLSCAVTCLPVYLSFGVSPDGRRDLRSVGMLLAGRLVAYLAVGALAGALGSAVGSGVAQRVSAVAMVPLCILLFLRAAGVFSRDVRLCALLSRVGQRVRSPLIVGFLLGFSICGPFLIAIAVAGSAGGAAGGMAVFGGFFVGTSAFLAPLIALPLIRGTRVREWLGRASPAVAAVLALLYLARALAIIAPAQPGPARATEADVRALFPDAAAVERIEGASPRYYRISSGTAASRAPMGYAVESLDCAPEVRGYAGPIPLLVALDPEGTVRGVAVLANDETPSYVSRLFSAESLARLVGVTAAAPLEIGTDVEAVSGATLSQRALTSSLRATIRVFSAGILHLEPRAPSDQSSGASTPAVDYRLVVYGAMALLSIGALFAGPRLRPWFLLAAVIALGLVARTFPSVSDVVRLLFGVPFALGDGTRRLLTVATAAGLTVALGRHYCSLLCPYGALQELVYTVSPLKRAVSPRLDRSLRAGKYLVLLALPFFFAFLRDFSVLSFEPFDPTFRALSSPSFALSLAASALPLLLLVLLLLAANLLSERFYCKYLCPLGALFGLLATARVVPASRFQARGRSCGACSKGLPGVDAECFACGGRAT